MARAHSEPRPSGSGERSPFIARSRMPPSRNPVAVKEADPYAATSLSPLPDGRGSDRAALIG